MKWLLALAVALTLAVTLASASLRLSQGGVGCTPWPACVASIRAARESGRAVEAPAWHEPVRLTHRVSASAAGLLYLFIALFGWSGWSRGARVAGVLLLADALFLAALGRITPSEHAGVVVGNLVGGFVLLAALAWLIAAPARPAAGRGDGSGRPGGWLLLGVLVAATATGALLGREPAWQAAAPKAIAAAPGLWWAHTIAAALAVALGVAGWMAAGRQVDRFVAVAVSVAALLGVGLWLRGGPSLALAVAHNLLAALAVAGAAWAVAVGRAAPAIDVAQVGGVRGSAH